MQVRDQALQDIRAHVLKCSPQEACGLIVAGEYIPCRNCSPTPQKDFTLNVDDQLAAEKKGPIEAVIHSHINQRIPTLSSADMISQQEMKIPWGVVFVRMGFAYPPVFFGDQVELAPLIGRTFIHGIYDCWQLVRDWFRVNKKISMPNPPRDWGWWEKGEDLYGEGIFKSFPGLRAVGKDEIQEGDILFGTKRSKVLNHAAVYLGNGLILSHEFGTLSRQEPLGQWINNVQKVMRYEVPKNA